MPWFLIGALAFEIALERCEGRADRSGNYLLDEKTVYLELIADIAEGSRQSAGINTRRIGSVYTAIFLGLCGAREKDSTVRKMIRLCPIRATSS